MLVRGCRVKARASAAHASTRAELTTAPVFSDPGWQRSGVSAAMEADERAGGSR